MLLSQASLILSLLTGHLLAKHLVKRSDQGAIVFGLEEAATKYDECLKKMKLYWPPTASCFDPAQRGPCPENQWIVARLDSSGENLLAECKPRPCPNSTESFWSPENKCYPKKTDAEEEISTRLFHKSHPCPSSKGLQLVDDPYGEGVCECQQNPEAQVFWNNTGRCYPLYKQGPCAKGEYVVYGESVPAEGFIVFEEEHEHDQSAKYEVRCERNPCPEGQVPFQADCYPLGSDEPCTEASSTLGINPKSLKLECLGGIRQIGYIAPRASFCQAGTVQDALGRCKTKYESFTG